MVALIANVFLAPVIVREVRRPLPSQRDGS